MCWESPDIGEISALAVDLSPMGLCIERPYTGGRTLGSVPLAFEVPGIDEVMWARGEACFDMVVADDSKRGGLLGMVRRTGYRIEVAARRDLRMLRDFVFDHYTHVMPDTRCGAV